MTSTPEQDRPTAEQPAEQPAAEQPDEQPAAEQEQATDVQPEVAQEQPAFTPVAAAPTLEQIRLAQEALDEVTPAGSVGDAVDATQTDEHVIEIRFACNLDGYPDWYWTASLATVDAESPTVLELALLPSDTSLLAPEWVPWAERLAEYLATKEAEEADHDEDDADDSDDDSDDDFDDFDDPDAPPYSDSRDEPFSPEDADEDDSDDSDENDSDDEDDSDDESD